MLNVLEKSCIQSCWAILTLAALSGSGLSAQTAGPLAFALAPGGPTPAGSTPVPVGVADFNANGHLDLVLVSSASEIAFAPAPPPSSWV